MTSSHSVGPVVVLVLLLSTFSISAQSGRRAPQGPPPAPPVAAPVRVYEPPTVSKPVAAPQFVVKLVTDLERVAALHLSIPPKKIRTWTLERLKATPLLEVRDAGESKADGAAELAKAETEVYVAALELKKDPYVRYGSSAAPPLILMLTVYHPNSGKVKFSRQIPVARSVTRPPASRAKLQVCNPDVHGDDIFLLEAGILAADILVSSFGFDVPALCHEVRN